MNDFIRVSPNSSVTDVTKTLGSFVMFVLPAEIEKRCHGEGAKSASTCMSSITVYTRVQVEFFGRENGLKKLTSTYIRENMRHTYRITKKCQNSLQQAKLRS